MSIRKDNAEQYFEFCVTERQKHILSMIMRGEKKKDINEKLGIGRRTVSRELQRIEDAASLRGFSPEHGMNFPTARTHFNKGQSTLHKVNPDGSTEVKLIWDKTTANHSYQIESLRESIRGMIEDVPKAIVPEPSSISKEDDIIPFFLLGDGHIGVIAYEYMIGHHTDTKETADHILVAMKRLIDDAPKTNRCAIVDLGDLSHLQDLKGLSESGHIFDYDEALPEVTRVATYVMRTLIEYAAQKFQYVDVIPNQGNHSRIGDIWMCGLLTNVYEDVDRITILNNDNVFIPYRMGNTFVLTHHGDKTKMARIPEVMVNDFSQDFGETKYRYAWSGHIHNRQAFEKNGIMNESWNQMSKGDAYAHDNGFRSRKCLSAVYLSKTYGEKGRSTVPIEEVLDIIEGLTPGTTAKKRRKVYTV